MNEPANGVLTDDAHTSANFFRSDRLLQSYLKKYLPGDAYNYMQPKLDDLGEQAAGGMNELSRLADRNVPELRKRSKLGKTINEIEFHPAYWEMMKIAARSEMLHVKYKPELRQRFKGNRHKLGFAAGQLYGMTELGQYCPLCMTDGTAYLIDRYAEKEDRERLLPKLSSKNGEDLYTGAMFLTEKSGGSDVGANLCRAEKVREKQYTLNGEKWFCSNVNADVMMVLARTGKFEEGSKGLSLFLVEKQSGKERNPLNIIRLKDKLGMRSMATGEVEFINRKGTLLGKEGEGFKIMAEMINLSRIYNSSAALAGARRAIIEAWQYLNHRKTFGKRAVEHAMVRQKFYELGARYLGDFALLWRAIRAMDEAENGNNPEKQLLRMIVPMAKWRLAESAVYIVRECMELIGGNGYIEDFVMPRLLRDVNVLPIWEGAGNMMVLDMLRALKKGTGLQLIIKKIEQTFETSGDFGQKEEARLNEIKSTLTDLKNIAETDAIEASARPIFAELILLYQIALLAEEKNTFADSAALALSFLRSVNEPDFEIKKPPSPDQINVLIGWEY